MTPSEFKAWFDGFVEALDGTPSEAQWARIKTRVAEIDGRAVTEHVYINRYLPYYPNYYCGTPSYPSYIPCTSNLSSGGTGTAKLTGNNTAAFDSHAAMMALGRVEAMGMAT